MNINIYWLLLIIPISILVGFGLCFGYILHTIKKAAGIKSWNKFINQIKQQRALQKKIEKEGIGAVLNDPKMRKQMEEFRRKFN